jgi:hypothetical protein
VKQSAFDTYEYVGIITPGAVLLTVLLFLFPDAKVQLAGREGIQIGALGIFLILSFVLGHIVQALGNIVGWLDQALSDGNASDRLLNPVCTIVNAKQRAGLTRALLDRLGVVFDCQTPGEWRTTRTEMYGIISAAEKSGRIDAFNRSYGLNKGLSCVFFISSILVIAVAEQPGIWGIVLAGSAVLSFNRMRYFSECYTRELVLEFIRACEPSAAKEAPAEESRREKVAPHPLAAIKVLPSLQGFPL